MRIDISGWCHDVIGIVAIASRDIIRIFVVRKSRDRHVVTSCDTIIHHTAAPGEYTTFTGKLLDAARFRQATDACDFDIDDLAAAKLDSASGIIDAVDTFIEADRCLDRLLQMAVIDNVIRCKRLLDHEKPQLIHFLEEIDIIQGIGRVRIDHQHDVAIFLADGAEIIDIIARFDLALHTAIALCHVFLDGVKQLVRRIFDAKRYARFDLIFDTAQCFVFRNAKLFGVKFPQRAVDGRTSHTVSADPAGVIEEPFRILEVSRLEEGWDQVFFDHEERTHGGFFVVPGTHEGGAGTIAHISITVMQLYDGEIFRRRKAEAGTEAHLEVQAHTSYDSFCNFHHILLCIFTCKGITVFKFESRD